MHEQDDASESPYRCFRCQAGCVHVVCGHTMLSLAPEQFLIFTDKVNAMRERLLEENDSMGAYPSDTALVM
jgi:hypothetical protein